MQSQTVWNSKWFLQGTVAVFPNCTSLCFPLEFTVGFVFAPGTECERSIWDVAELCSSNNTGSFPPWPTSVRTTEHHWSKVRIVLIIIATMIFYHWDTFDLRSLLVGVLSKGHVRCPWHGACFSTATGDIEDFPGLDSLPTFQVTFPAAGPS